MACLLAVPSWYVHQHDASARCVLNVERHQKRAETVEVESNLRESPAPTPGTKKKAKREEGWCCPPGYQLMLYL
eukprot:scaffold1018_cov92-Skeletonema_dohrnii-CCMP3373.AAC.1